MLLAPTLVASLVLLAEAASAARLPKSPRSSLQDSAQLKREIQKRQANPRDVARRERDGPKRKRADPSAPAGPVVDVNLLRNGGFEDATGSDFLPWQGTSTFGTTVFGVIANLGYGSSPNTASNGFVYKTDTNGGGGIIDQTVSLLPGLVYDVSFVVGLKQEFGSDCLVEVKLTGGLDQTLYSAAPCSDDVCDLDNGNGQRFLAKSSQIGPFATTTDVSMQVSFLCFQGDGPSNPYLFDKAVIARAA